MLNFAAIVPHPPAIIPESSSANLSPVKKTLKSLEKLGDELKIFQPHTIVVVSPHGPMRYDKFTINLEDDLQGSFSKFGFYDSETHRFRNNSMLSRQLLDNLKKADFPIEPIREEEIDYGSLIPLHYLTKTMVKKPKIVLLTFTSLDWKTHYSFGKHMKLAIEEADYNIAFIASADLSHRISDDSPAGYSPYGIRFDKTLQNLLKKGEVEKILDLNPDFCEEAGECGLKSIITALGLIEGQKENFIQYSYEHPFGVGYLTGRWKLKN